MSKLQNTSIIDNCDKVTKISTYLLVFLLPVLFLPWTANVSDFNKQALLIVLVLVSIFAWMLKILTSGKASFNFSLVHIPIAVFFLVYVASSIFSKWFTGSFWGWPLLTSESALTVLGLTLLYFLIVNAFRRKEIFYLVVTLIASSTLAMFYGLLQLFGKFIFPISFTKSISFNTVGGINTLAVLAGIMLPLVIAFLTISKDKKLKILFIVSAILSAILLLLINFNVAWWVVIIGSALIIVFGTQRRDIFDGRWLILPMFFLAIALLFSFFNFSIPGKPQTPAEFSLTHKATFDIAKQSLQESPVVGSGPGTFVYNFAKFKDPKFNQSDFWNVKFDWGSSKVLTLLATVGVLGALSFLGLIAVFVFYGIKFLFSKSYQKKEEDDLSQEFYWTLGMGLFVSFIVTTVLFFFYRSSISIDFIYFALMAFFVSLLYPIRKEFELKPSSLVTLAVTFGFTVVFILGLGVLIIEGQRYVSAVSYLNSMKAMGEGRRAQAIERLETAVRLNQKVDLYWRDLSQLHLAGIREAENSQEVQSHIRGTVGAAKNAIEVNPNNVTNWANRGNVYQNLIGIVDGTKEWSVEAYQKAMELEPANPLYPNQAGISILTKIRSLTKEATQQEKIELFNEAEEKFNQAIELKENYAPAYFQLAILNQLKGDSSEMERYLNLAKEAAPLDVNMAFQTGLIYYQLKDWQKAREELERTITLSPGYANALYFLGLVYDQQGEKAKALTVFESLNKTNPENGVVIQVLKNLRAGKKALSGMGREAEEPPIEEELEK